eukprot:GHVT01088557.1.p1 GENE.GHVT01088557.1~~GHVT01088557.1.p1  ORF type:complete len:363 (-),score=125.78 GHVT01088557.1:1208-2188(-)
MVRAVVFRCCSAVDAAGTFPENSARGVSAAAPPSGEPSPPARAAPKGNGPGQTGAHPDAQSVFDGGFLTAAASAAAATPLAAATSPASPPAAPPAVATSPAPSPATPPATAAASAAAATPLAAATSPASPPAAPPAVATSPAPSPATPPATAAAPPAAPLPAPLPAPLSAAVPVVDDVCASDGLAPSGIAASWWCSARLVAAAPAAEAAAATGGSSVDAHTLAAVSPWLGKPGGVPYAVLTGARTNELPSIAWTPLQAWKEHEAMEKTLHSVKSHEDTMSPSSALAQLLSSSVDADVLRARAASPQTFFGNPYPKLPPGTRASIHQ